MSAGRKGTRRAAGSKARAASPSHPVSTIVSSAELPWFPFLSEGIHLKLCRANLATGETVLMLRLDPGTGLASHYQHGLVTAYTIAGRWRMRGEEEIAGPGDVLVAPAGSTRAIEAVGDRPMEAFVHATGALEFLDEGGKTLCIENAETLHGRYLAYCALHGLAPAEVASR